MLCPYRAFLSLFNRGLLKDEKTSLHGAEAKSLRVQVKKEGVLTVDVELPAVSARWLFDLIPDEVVKKILAEGIPLMEIQNSLAQSEKLVPGSIFSLTEAEREVSVWLEA